LKIYTPTIVGITGFTGATSGTVLVKAATAAGNWTLTLPVNDGDANQFLQTDGDGYCSWTVPVPTSITVAVGSGDTTCFPLFVTGSTAGNYGPLVHASITVDSTTGYLGAAGMAITGNGSGTTAQVVNVLYGTGAAPSAAGLPYGTLYFRYTA